MMRRLFLRSLRDQGTTFVPRLRHLAVLALCRWQ
jgi:hypothetical protein